MEHLTDFVFISLGNFTLARRDSYRTHVKTGIKPDTLAALRTAVETYTRSEQSKSIPQGAKIQNGDNGNHQDLPPARGVGYLNRLQRCLLPHTIQEQSRFHVQGKTCQSKALPFGLSTAPMEFTVIAK